MSFFDDEKSKHDSKPIELYHFYRDTTNYYFTSSDKSVFFNAKKYIPASFVRTSIKQANEISRTDLKVNITTENPFYAETQVIYPKRAFNLDIYRYQPNSNEAIVIWSGTVEQATYFNILKVELLCQNISEKLRKNSLRYSYQNTCNHTQYGASCGLDIENFTESITVELLEEENIKITSNGLTNQDTDYYRGGVARHNGEIRNIKVHDVDYIVLERPFTSLVEGDIIQVSYGCKYSKAGCKLVNNFENNFGFQYIPSDNPYKKTII